MKQTLSFLASLLLAVVLPHSAKAYDFSAVAPTGQTLYYNIVTGGVEVTSENSNYPYYTTSPTGALTIPSSVTYGGTTYAVTSIGDYAFSGCSGLTSITIPNSVTSIGNGAFSDCIGLTSVTIPDGVTSIGSYAFYGCSGLTSVTIPDGITSIGDEAFVYCSGLTSITIPNSVTSIGNEAFYNCSGLTSITIPNSVTSIGDWAFRDCSGLTSITIPDGVTSIGDGAFYGCSGLASVTIPDGVTSIGNDVFSGCSGLTSVTIPSGVTSIGSFAFCNCSGLTSVTIPDGVTSIGGYAFEGCSGLTSVTIPDGVTSIGEWAFAYCSGLTTVTIPDGVTSIGEYTFCGCSGLTSVTIPDGVTSIGGGAFAYCSGLTTVYFNADRASTFSYSFNSPFNYCTNISSFIFGDNVRVIPASICSGITGLTSVTIPDGVTSIGERAFSGCSGLTSVTIPDGVTWISDEAFYGCSGLTSVYFNADSCASVSSNIFSSCPNISSFVFGDSVRVIPSYICSGMTGLTSVTIPDGVTSIGHDAFYSCSGLTSVTIGNSVTSIGDYAFSGCNGLTSVTIPDGVTSIGWNAFKDCSGLTSVTIGNGVTSIGFWAFAGCSGLTEIHSRANGAPTLGWDDVFSGVTSTIPVYVPCGSSDSYYDRWSYFSNIIEEVPFSFGAESADSTMGTVQILTMPTCTNPNMVVNAVPAEGYHFDHWSTGSTANPDTIILIGDTIVTAFFAPNLYSLTVNAGEHGTVSGSGTYSYGDTITIQAFPDEHYHFIHWDDGNSDNPRQVVMTGDLSYTAYFVIDTHTVTVESADLTMGTVSGGGQAQDGGTVTIRAVGNPGYHFLRWNDNNTDSVRTVEVHGDVTYTAYFEPDETEGIDNARVDNIRVWSTGDRIYVEGMEGETVYVFDGIGRIVSGQTKAENGVVTLTVPTTGVYMVRVGDRPARRVVVIR